MAETVRTNGITPETALISVLLLFAGAIGVISDPANIWQMLASWQRSVGKGAFSSSPNLPMAFSVIWQTLELCLAVASIVCGTGMLRQAPWARRRTIVVLLALCGLPLIIGITNIIGSLAGLFNNGIFTLSVTSQVKTALLSLLDQFPFALILVFVLTSPQADPAEEQSTLGPLQRLAEKIRRLLPGNVPA
ncbi:MAG TPA: hypothetical protein VHV83_08735, partial [Armatimonadota bacterium]|nr:hypothetical protein [Armatimonadota bacterium]